MIRATTTYAKRAGALVSGLFAAFVLLTSTAVADELRFYGLLAKEVQDEVIQFLNKELADEIGMPIVSLALSTGELHARIMAEAPNVGADVVLHLEWGGIKMIEAGLVQPFLDAPAWKDIPARYKQPDGYYYNLGTFSFVLVGNKDRLKEKGYSMPESYFDLLDPKWKGEILMPSPVTSGTAAMINASILSLFKDEDAGWSFLEHLDKNVAQYTKSGNTPTTLVARGEFMLGLTSDENVTVVIKEGYPLVWKALREGIGAEGNVVMIVKGTKHLEEAKTLINFMGTEKFQLFFAQYGYLAARPGIKSSLYPIQPKFIEYDAAWAAENRDRILKIWKGKFLMR